jgi:phosphatidate phosphatase APP1
LSFILIGDGGEKDGDIYKDIAKKFPGQISAIYLRSVADKKRVEPVSQLFNEFKEIPFLLVDKTNGAIQQAKTNGSI